MKMFTNSKIFVRTALVAALAAGLTAASAEAWDAPVQLDDSTSGVPVLAQDGKGKIVAIWKRLDGIEQELWSSQKPAGGQFRAPVRISTPGATVGGFDLAANRKGLFTAVWAEDEGIDATIYASDLLPKTTTFTAGVPISALGQDMKLPTVALDKKGTTFAAWAAETGPGLEVATRPAKGSFAPALAIAPTHVASSVSIGASDDGSAVLIWSRWNGMTNEAYSSVRRPKQSFEPADQISTPEENASNPYLTVHPRGGASVFYFMSTANLQPGAALFDAPVATGQLASPLVFRYDRKGNLYAFWTRIGPAFKAILAIRPAGSDTFGPEIEFGDGVDDASAGDVAVDRKGNVRVVWTQSITGVGTVVRTAHRPVGGTFSDPEDVTEVGPAYAPHLFLDKKGLATVVWRDYAGALWATSQSE